MTPDRTIVRALHRIEPKLAVVWDTEHERWAIYHDLPEAMGNLDSLVERMTTELCLTYLEAGHVVDRETAGRLCLQAVKNAALVCYVTEEDGGYRPLDARIVEKFRKMDSLRRNCGLRDWQEMLAARRYAVERSEELAREDFYQYQTRDAVLQRVLSDVLWGVPVTRSIYLKRPEDEEHLPPDDEEADEEPEKSPGEPPDTPRD